MEVYIKNIKDLNELLGYDEDDTYEAQDIGYGEKAFVFQDITDLCEGRTKGEKLDDFMENADVGQAFRYRGLWLCKCMRADGDIEVVYEDANGDVHQL